jgi:hypothetical protein
MGVGYPDLFALLIVAMQVVYGVLLSLVMYGLLWAFGTVFAASLAANVPTPLTNYVTCDNERETTACVGPYRAFLLLFAVIVVRPRLSRGHNSWAG